MTDMFISFLWMLTYKEEFLLWLESPLLNSIHSENAVGLHFSATNCSRGYLHPHSCSVFLNISADVRCAQSSLPSWLKRYDGTGGCYELQHIRQYQERLRKYGSFVPPN